jgi:ABC-type transporter Mla subunit MlaD
MLSFAILFVFATFSSTFTLPLNGINEVASLISTEDCNFYTTLNTLFECGPKSHLMQYSYKYCQRLVDVRNTFDNTQYQDDARQCLQQKLFTKIQQAGEGTITCDSFKQMDLDSHGSCLAVSFKQLSAKDVVQFLAIFKDTTVNFGQLCQLANSFAGHWSKSLCWFTLKYEFIFLAGQIVNGDLMQFVKQQLKIVFPEGDTSACSIKEMEIIEEIVDIISKVTKIVDQVNSVKDDVILIIEKAKAIRDDFKSIQDIVKGIKNGSISELNGIKSILQKSKDLASDSKTIIDTIKNLAKGKTNQTSSTGGKYQCELIDRRIFQISILENADIDRAIQDIIAIVEQVETLKGEVYNVIDNVDSIIDTINDIRDGKTNIFDGLEAIVNQVNGGIDNIYSIISTSYTIKETVIDLVESVIKDLGGLVDEGGKIVEEIIDEGGKKVDEIIDEGGKKIEEITGGLGGIGGLGGFGK